MHKRFYVKQLPGILLVLCLTLAALLGVLAEDEDAIENTETCTETMAQWAVIEAAAGDNNKPLFDAAVSYLISGKCGDNAAFTYDPATKALVISGTGPLYDYSSGTETPWGAIRGEIVTVVIENGITHLGKNMFNKADSLISITLPEGLECIAFGALANCSKLETLVLPEGLKVIASRAMVSMTAMREIYLPSTLKAIDLKAFDKCTALTDVYYNGTAGDWNQVIISTQQLGNAKLLNANMHYLKAVQTFTDAPANSDYYDAATYLVDNHYLTVNAQTFGVDTAVDLDMILTILYNKAGAPGMYDSAWDWAVSNKLVNTGVNGEVALSELAVMLYRTAILNGQVTENSATDETEAAFAWCAEQGYFAEIDSNDESLARGKAAQIMAAYLQSTASQASRNADMLTQLKEALAREGGDGKLYVYAVDLALDVRTSKKQGDCVFILFPNGETMLIDTAYTERANTVLNMLNELGLTGMDHLMISHSDIDHTGNAVAVVNQLNGNIGTLYLNGLDYRSRYMAIRNACSESTVVQELRRGDTLEIGGVTAKVYNPSSAFVEAYLAGTETENNNASIAVKFTYGASTFLTCGDLYERMELDLVALYGSELKADVVKANHHAAYTSNVDSWVDTTDPLILFAETDDNGTTKLMNYAAEKGIAYYTYGMDGSVLIVMDASRNYEVTTQKDSVLRTNYHGEVGKAEARIGQSEIVIAPVGALNIDSQDVALTVSGGAEELDYQYSSSDTSVVTVDENGVLHVVGAGTAVITVTKSHKYYQTATAEIEITVT